MAKLELLLAGMNKEPEDTSVADTQKKMVSALKSLVDESSRQQNAAFSNAVQQAVLAISQSNQTMLNSLERMSREAQTGQRGLSKSIEANGKAGSEGKQAIQNQLKTLSAELAKLPTSFPIPKDVDLSGLSKDIKTVAAAVKNIPAAEFPSFPKPVDLTPQFQSIEKKLNKRVHVFEIERDSLTELITKITVRTK